MEQRDNRKNQESGTENDKNLPGYPHYPENEDILSTSSGMHRTDADIEDIPRSGKLNPTQLAGLNEDDVPPAISDRPGNVSATDPEADLNEDDLLALGSDTPAGETDPEKPEEGSIYAHDASGSDLDVPGSELDDASESLGSEDEENNLYSLGGDNHD